MKILFLSYWGIEDGLTAATVIPHLRILDRFQEVSEILFCTIERTERHSPVNLPGKVKHWPLESGKKIRDKIFDFIRFPSLISKVVKDQNIAFMFCRGTPAGALGHIVHTRTGIGYAVESFEPHAQYMVESGVWTKFGFRYILQRWWESRQMKTARYLLPVADGMKKVLEMKAVKPGAIFVMPCAVDHERFYFQPDKRNAVRASLKIPAQCLTGIYVGKFGGLYYDREAFHILNCVFNSFPGFKLIILTPDHVEETKRKLSQQGINSNDYHVLSARHDEVPAYLSAADFAFSFVKPSPSKTFSSPIKIGEYWATGLPVLIAHGVGDDSAIIERNNAGAVFETSNLQPAIDLLKKILEGDRLVSRNKIRELALRHRNFELDEEIYRTIIHEIAG
jgi:glycosyltransferase involved in cell wall biosynthesis